MTTLASLQVGSAISYAVAIIIPALDAILPVLPSETVIIALGVATAGSTDPASRVAGRSRTSPGPDCCWRSASRSPSAG